ncbi:MAG: hypothetical protein U0519_00430 [Candidatus Gracilibacteria bacterium]
MASVIRRLLTGSMLCGSIIQGTLYGFIDQTAQCTKGILDKTCS